MSETSRNGVTIQRLETGIPGFDLIAEGGLPRGRTTLVSGTAGSGKTLLGLQFLVTGVRDFDEGGVLVTFEEAVRDLVRNVSGLGWDLGSLIEEEKVAVVDASPEPGEQIIEVGGFDFSALLARIEYAVQKSKATRVVLDALGSVFPQFHDSSVVRSELHRIAVGLREMKVTSIITIERGAEDGDVSRFGVEEFVADNVIILRNRLENEKRRRTIEILKFRGATHQKGEFPFTIDADIGITALPLSAIELTQRSSNVRITSGNRVVDEMCGGGLFRDSIILVTGATGTGKTLMTTQFLQAAINAGERALLLAFEESRHQLFRNAASWGCDFEAAEQSGMLRVIARYPETMSLEDHLLHIKRDIEDFRPQRIAIDSLSALERVSSPKGFREFVIGITSHVKEKELAGMFTNTSSMLMGGETVTETHISSITDCIFLLRYVELHGDMRRGIAILKMRGSIHDKSIREYTIDNAGMHVGESFRGVHGILTGAPRYSFYDMEKRRLDDMFES